MNVGQNIHSNVTGINYNVTWVSPDVAQAIVGFANGSDGEEYFIKRLLTPIYPADDAPLSTELLNANRNRADKFFTKFSPIYERVRKGSGKDSACVPILDFFREGSFFYTTYKKINAESLTISEISSFNKKDKYKILLDVVLGLLPLHSLGVIHGDLKPDNILIQKTEDSWQVRLIDMNDCYKSGEPKEPGAVVGTPEYYSPELAEYNDYEVEDWDDEEEMAYVKKLAKTLTQKSDVFALGIIFCEYYSGSRPNITDEKTKSIYKAVAKDAIEMPSIVKEDPRMESLLLKMLNKDFKKRISLSEVGDELKKIIANKPSKPEILKEEIEDAQEFLVSLTTSSDGDIHYTINNTDPTEKSEIYRKPFKVKPFTTVKAITYNGEKKSEMTSIMIWQGKKNNSHSPKLIVKGKLINLIKHDSSPVDTKLYYTTDGTNPTNKSCVYEGEFCVDDSITLIKAMAIEPSSNPSPIVEAKVYKLKLQKPELHYKRGVITLSTVGDWDIYYTLDGSKPSSKSLLYKEKIVLPDTSKFHVRAVCINSEGNVSEEVSVQRPNSALKINI